MTPPTTPANAGNLRRWIEALESQDAPEQLKWVYYDQKDDGPCCAVGLAMRVLNIHDPFECHEALVGSWSITAMGLPVSTWNDDECLTFPQIAAKIREWAAANGIDLSTAATVKGGAQ